MNGYWLKECVDAPFIKEVSLQQPSKRVCQVQASWCRGAIAKKIKGRVFSDNWSWISLYKFAGHLSSYIAYGAIGICCMQMKFYTIPHTRYLEDLEESVNSGDTPILLTMRRDEQKHKSKQWRIKKLPTISLQYTEKNMSEKKGETIIT